MMPENRARRWSSIFRRYGIPNGTETEPETTPDIDALKKKAQESLLPGELFRSEKPPRSRRAQDE